MPTPVPAGRLPALRAALERYAATDLASQKELAELYGVAPSRLSTLVKTRFKSFPAVAERRDDKTHWYPARAAIEAMIAYIEGAGEERQAQARRHTDIMAGAEPARAAAEREAADAEPPMTASEIDRLVSAQARLWKLAKDQGMYVLAADMQQSARKVNALYTRSVTSIPSRIDPNGQLPPDVRDKLEKACRQVIVDLRVEMMEMMGADDEAVELARSGSRAQAGHGRRRDRRRG